MVVKSEEYLVEAAQNGHLQSFAALYERYHSSMVALAYSALADIQLSEDAAQEVFVIACRDLPKLKDKDKFGAWLAGICRNVARQVRRSKGKVVAVDEEVPAETSIEDFRNVVRRAVWKLRAVEREPIVLRYYDNMSYEQIGSVLGISAQAVHGRLTRAKRKIADNLKRNGFTGGDYEGSRKQ
ncbi:MAG: RNA polymerase sigma factor [Planctomycetota bacterium]